MRIVHVTDVTGRLVAPEWLARARAEVSEQYFEVPANREIYQTLLSLAVDAPMGDAATRLSPRSQEVFQRLSAAAAAAQAGGIDLDAEYAGAVQRLKEARASGLVPRDVA